MPSRRKPALTMGLTLSQRGTQPPNGTLVSIRTFQSRDSM